MQTELVLVQEVLALLREPPFGCVFGRCPLASHAHGSALSALQLDGGTVLFSGGSKGVEVRRDWIGMWLARGAGVQVLVQVAPVVVDEVRVRAAERQRPVAPDVVVATPLSPRTPVVQVVSPSSSVALPAVSTQTPVQSSKSDNDFSPGFGARDVSSHQLQRRPRAHFAVPARGAAARRAPP